MKKPTQMKCFNTQPPKGGWGIIAPIILKSRCFNTQPPKGGWLGSSSGSGDGASVSTHSRLKAAGGVFTGLFFVGIVSTHSRLKAAGFRGLKCAVR